MLNASSGEDISSSSTQMKIKVEVFDGEKITRRHLRIRDKWKYIQSNSKILGDITCRLLRGNVNYSVLLESLLQKIVNMLESEIGLILSYDNRTSLMRCSAIAEKTPGLVNTDVYSDTNNMSKCRVFLDAIGKDKIIISNSYQKDPRTSKRLPGEHVQIHRFLTVPLKYNDNTIGLLVIANRSDRYGFTSIRKLSPFLDICGKLLVQAAAPKESFAERIHKSRVEVELKDKFLATMSHELRTPLNGIMGMVTLLPGAGELNEKQTEYVRNLTECAVELTSLLNNILDFSKMAADRLALRREPFLIEDSIRDSIKIIESNLLSKDLQLKTKIQDLPKMIGDKQRITQILTNLLGNACKFTDRGFISVTVTAKKVGDGSASSSSSLSPSSLRKWQVHFDIQDTGVGIPPDEQDRIFEVFHQSKTLNSFLSSTGTGLGLSICRELVRMMKGKISVYSEGIKGKGSTFSFYILLDEDINVSLMATSQQNLLSGTRILVVDDRPEIRLQVSDILFRWKCIPQAVSSAEEALQYLQYGIDFSTCIIDICMPNMSGVELAQELRQKYPHISLIGMSSVELSSGEEYFDHYMYKPVDQSTLFPALINCLQLSSQKTRPRPISIKKSRSRLRILVAEDDKHNTFTIKEMLLSLGYQKENIFFADNGEKCVSLAKKSQPDVILMDIIMPRMGGLQASKLIKRFKDPPTIIAVSAAVQPSDKARCQDAGIDGYLPKPIIRDKLDAALSPLLSQKRRLKENNNKEKDER